MGAVVFGQRAYGKVDAQDGEHAVTEFVHLDFVPLIPLNSFWITSEVRRGEWIGIPIKLHLRSVAATYLRVWGPMLAALAIIGWGSRAAMTVAGGLLVLSGWSWTWRSRRGTRARQRGDFDRVALGTRCPPLHLTDEMRDRLERELSSRLARRDDARPPDDVARFGAKDADEAILAYGLLRLSAVRHRPAAAAADRLLASEFEALPSDGGPYREQRASEVAAFGAQVLADARAARETFPRPAAPRWYQRSWVQLVFLAAVTPVVWIQLTRPDIGIRRPRFVGIAELTASSPLAGKYVRVLCDRRTKDGWEHDDGPGRRVTACWIAERMLPIVSSVKDPVDSRIVVGRLDGLPTESRSWAEAMRGDPTIGPRALDLCLYRDVSAPPLRAVLTALCSVATLFGWLVWSSYTWRRFQAWRDAANAR